MGPALVRLPSTACRLLHIFELPLVPPRAAPQTRARRNGASHDMSRRQSPFRRHRGERNSYGRKNHSRLDPTMGRCRAGDGFGAVDRPFLERSGLVGPTAVRLRPGRAREARARRLRGDHPMAGCAPLGPGEDARRRRGPVQEDRGHRVHRHDRRLAARAACDRPSHQRRGPRRITGLRPPNACTQGIRRTRCHTANGAGGGEDDCTIRREALAAGSGADAQRSRHAPSADGREGAGRPQGRHPDRRGERRSSRAGPGHGVLTGDAAHRTSCVGRGGTARH